MAVPWSAERRPMPLLGIVSISEIRSGAGRGRSFEIGAVYLCCRLTKRTKKPGNHACPQGFWPGQEPKPKAQAQAREKKKKEAHTTEKHDKAYHPAAEHTSFSRRVDVVVVAVRFIVGYGIVRRRVDLFEGLRHVSSCWSQLDFGSTVA